MTNSLREQEGKSPVVYVMDDDEIYRARLEQALPSIGLKVRSYASANEFLLDFDSSDPGCIVADVRMPGISGLELQARLVQEAVHLPLILITAHAEVSMAVKALKAGAVDFVEKPFSIQELLEKIQRAVRTDIARRSNLARYKEIRGCLDSLTKRERQVMQVLVDGQTSKEICRTLKISLPTVDFHRRNVLKKFGVENTVQLTRLVDFLDHFRH